MDINLVAKMKKYDEFISNYNEDDEKKYIRAIIQCGERKVSIERKNHTFAYSLFGTLDIARGILESVINFEIDKEELYNYGYLDGKQVQVDVLRVRKRQICAIHISEIGVVIGIWKTPILLS